MYNNLTLKKATRRIEEYLAARGFTVKYNSNNYYINLDAKSIHAPKRYRHQLNSICALLHEAGHAEAVQSQLLYIHQHHFSKKHKNLARAIVIEQEYLAWSRGEYIARELNIDTPQLLQRYRKQWIACWSTYLNAGCSPAVITAAESYYP